MIGMAKSKLFYSGTIALILPGLKDITQTDKQTNEQFLFAVSHSDLLLQIKTTESLQYNSFQVEVFYTKLRLH